MDLVSRSFYFMVFGVFPVGEFRTEAVWFALKY
jgi:hypothetical protein